MLHFFEKILKWTVGILFFGILIVGGALVISVMVLKSPAKVEVDISPGLTVRQIGETLTRAGAIKTPEIFLIWSKVQGIEGKLKAGYYEFEQGLTLEKIADKIARGDVKYFTFTIIEGWRIEEIAAELAKQPFIADTTIVDRFRALTRDPAFITSLGFSGATSLEGYLFPDTYKISRPHDAEEIIKQIVFRFRGIFSPEIHALAKEMGMTQHDVVTLASIIEKETGKEEERPIIASVFLNRLKQGIPLASDPTVIYGLPHFDGNLRKQDLSNPHPYNTYVHPGLPPGPIASPGRASIEAVLHPAETSYLYFVSRGDGTHKFSSTLSEHLQAVMEFQVRPAQL